MLLRLLASLVPEFRLDQGQWAARSSQGGGASPGAGRGPPSKQWPVSPELASVVREYISSDALKACLNSFNEPYFVEVQKELAMLIATILVHYGPLTPTPRNVLLSLPNVNANDLDRLTVYMAKPGTQTRQQRAIVLDMLKDLKGVSVSEMGKLAKSSGFGSSPRGKRHARSKMAQAFIGDPALAAGGAGGGGPGMVGPRRATPDGLDGVSNLFED